MGQVQLRLLQYWRFQALVEAAAERYPITRVEQQRAGSGEGGAGEGGVARRIVEATIPSRPGLKVQVAVPAGWPRLAALDGGAAAAAGGGLALAGAAGGGADAAALAEAVARDAAMGGRDLLGFLEGVEAKLEAGVAA